MKKVLVLMLVLGMASLANAGLVLNINGAPAADMTVPVGTVLNLSLVSDGDVSLSYIDLVQGTGSILADAAAGAAIGDMGSVTAAYDNGLGQDEIAITQAFSGAGFAGVIATATITVGDSALIQLWDNAIGYEQPAGQWLISTPEPATMLILGLGALLLRRK